LPREGFHESTVGAGIAPVPPGSRDRTLADNPDLDYTSDAEILFLLEALERP
jgi:hypothetical protein